MDVLVETLVRRKLTAEDKKKVKLIFFTIIFSSFLLVLVVPILLMSQGIAYLSTASMLLFGVVLFLCYRELKKMQLEFEYIITGTNLDIDKIIDKKKRLRLISFDLKTVEGIGIYKHNFEGQAFEKVIHAERDLRGENNYFITLNHPKYSRVLIVFTPDERMIDGLKKTLPRSLLREL